MNNIRDFIAAWSGRGSEKSHAQAFWLDLLAALGVDRPSNFIQFEVPVEVDGHPCSIDGFIPATKVLVENKSRGIDLDKPAKQSDGKLFTPFEQAKRYADALPYSRRPRWIVVCNFDEFRICDLDRLPTLLDDDRARFQTVKLAHLVPQFKRLKFLVDPNDDDIEEVKISADAADIISRIRDSFARKMLHPRRVKDDPVDFLSVKQKNMLNRFCVRLVFCLYAQDAAVFEPEQFSAYLKNSFDRREAFFDLFDVLNTPPDRRDPNLRTELKQFPYVNGGLFAGAALELPPFDETIAAGITLENFNWFAINPTIFGAIFESNLTGDRRRAGGMHYTSRANIHKIIDPLFLDDLHDEFAAIKRKRKNKRRDLEALQTKISELTFFDPACGSGNFLTETFISLRQLENKILDALIDLGAPCTVKVSIDRFFGVEINDFAVAIAQTALLISEHKMLYDTDIGIRERVQYLPLKHSARIVCANALALDWNEVVPDGVDYIIGNPPFVGHQWRTPAQVADMVHAFRDLDKHGKLDYVCAWFNKAADFMSNNLTRAAFVATNSICQGESVGILWRHLFDKGVHIDFAHRTFRWTSESENVAAVHCVIVGFSVAPSDRPRIIFDGDQKIVATNINGRLLDAPNVFIQNRGKPLTPNLPIMTKGSQPTDGGHLLLTPEERDELVRLEPRAEKFIRRYIGAEEFINGKDRYCLWLVHATEDDLRMPLIAERLMLVAAARRRSATKSVRKQAATPHLFTQIRQPDTDYLVVPEVTSSQRKYIPIGFLPSTTIVSNKIYVVAEDDLYFFGVLTSIVHMAWMRIVCGRLGNGYSYSPSVYNNFPWCGRSPVIEQTARAILDARAQYPSWTLAALYDQQKMPPELRAAHEANDEAVLDAYCFARSMSEAEIVSRLMEIYQRLTAGAPTDKI